MVDTKLIAPNILKNKSYSETSIFKPENLLRESRRQNSITKGKVPAICILDPDGDLVDYLNTHCLAEQNKYWACYHSNLFTFQISGETVGIIPCAVGASYAVLVAEQLFVSGCELLISVTSAGVIQTQNIDNQFALITEAIRDEGTSYHYIPADELSTLSRKLISSLTGNHNPWFEAKSWTTDAPFRETKSAIQEMQEQNVVCVEMEAAALYAFGKAKNKEVICFAHLTNAMAQEEGDFEKGEYFGSLQMLNLIQEVLKKLI
jgi:uridine phosphorylase|tara:strand:- start:436 stop:1221 length:786 start_codon:yes stop_codon:yes gene_type:complete